MCKLNLWVYDSLLVLLDAVRLYKVYRRLDTLHLYLYYELLVLACQYFVLWEKLALSLTTSGSYGRQMEYGEFQNL